MQPIETRWRDRLYRSRTEARWAVALTLSRVSFDYEAEGFALPSGWYLPDFWLPKRALWIEVKGVDPTERERRLGIELEAQSGFPVYFGVGSPAPSSDWQEVDHYSEEFAAELRIEWLKPEARARALAERFDGKPVSPPPRAASLRSLRSLETEFRNRAQGLRLMTPATRTQQAERRRA